VSELDLSQLPIVEMVLAVSLTLLMVAVYSIGRRSARAKADLDKPSRNAFEPQVSTSPLRRLEQDLSFLVDFINEFPTLMSELNAQHELRQIPGVLCNTMVRVFRAEQAVVLVRRKGTIADPERTGRLIVAAVSASERGLDVGTEIPVGEGQLGIVAQNQQVMDRGDFNALTDVSQMIARGPRLPFFEVVAPMVHAGDTLGVIAFSRPQRHHPREKDMLHMIAQFGALTWQNLSEYRHVKVAADVDELTQIYNKRALKFRLSELVYESRQNSNKVSVFLFDIDHFKNYNDLNGHIAGDQALRLLAQLVRDTVRADDIFGRFGGEEFLLIMPGRTPAQAMSAAGNIRQRIAAFEFPFGDKQPLGMVSVSGGVSTFPDDAQDAVEMLLAADAALYRAKEAGRNKVLRAETGISPLSVPQSITLDDDDSNH
jgi:diguanylate cyclase (GGDEF)-like protein